MARPKNYYQCVDQCEDRHKPSAKDYTRADAFVRCVRMYDALHACIDQCDERYAAGNVLADLATERIEASE
jgi:hypothetical protein